MDLQKAVQELLKRSHSGFKAGGYFDFVCKGPDGKIKWVERSKNLVTNVGLNHILDVVFHGTTPVSPWYVGLKGTGSEAAGDTLASHAGWSEITDYTGDRKAYDEAAASSQSITNSASVATFAINATVTIAGAFLCSVATTTTGVLICVADFSASRSMSSGDTLEVTYTISAADDGS